MIYLVSQIVNMYSKESDPAKQLIKDGAVMLIIKPLTVDGKKKKPISNYFLEWRPGTPRSAKGILDDVNIIKSIIS